MKITFEMSKSEIFHIQNHSFDDNCECIAKILVKLQKACVKVSPKPKRKFKGLKRWSA